MTTKTVKAKPSKDMLTLLAMRDKMVVAKRYGEIERMEKEIEAMRLKVKLRET